MVARDCSGPVEDGLIGAVCTFRTQGIFVLDLRLQDAADRFLAALEAQTGREWELAHAMPVCLGSLRGSEQVLVSPTVPIGPPGVSLCRAESLCQRDSGDLVEAPGAQFERLTEAA